MQLEGCIVWNDTIQYSPEAVRCPCISCLLPAFDDAEWHLSATEWCQRYLPRYLYQFPIQSAFFRISVARPHQHCGVLLVLIRNIGQQTLPKIWVGTFPVRSVYPRGKTEWILTGLTIDSSQLKFLPSSKTRNTKIGQNYKKNPTRWNLDIIYSLRISGQLPL